MVHMDGQDATGHEAGAHLKDRTELLFVRTYGDGAYMAFRDLYLIYDAWTVERALREAMAYNPVNPVRYIAAICARECRQRVMENGGRPSSGTAVQRDSGEVIL